MSAIYYSYSKLKLINHVQRLLSVIYLGKTHVLLLIQIKYYFQTCYCAYYIDSSVKKVHRYSVTREHNLNKAWHKKKERRKFRFAVLYSQLLTLNLLIMPYVGILQSVYFYYYCTDQVLGGAWWRSGSASDSESRGPGIRSWVPSPLAALCCVLEQGTLTPNSTVEHTGSSGSVPT